MPGNCSTKYFEENSGPQSDGDGAALALRVISNWFRSGMHASDGGFVPKQAAELSREWGEQIYVVQLTLTKACDRIKKSTVIGALQLQWCSEQCMALFGCILSQFKCQFV